MNFSGMEARPARCNCPSPDELFRATGTKDDCPVHPMPGNLGDLIVPRVNIGEIHPIILRPLIR